MLNQANDDVDKIESLDFEIDQSHTLQVDDDLYSISEGEIRLFRHSGVANKEQRVEVYELTSPDCFIENFSCVYSIFTHKIYTCGGRNNADIAIDQVMSYDIRTDEWICEKYHLL